MIDTKDTKGWFKLQTGEVKYGVIGLINCIQFGKLSHIYLNKMEPKIVALQNYTLVFICASTYQPWRTKYNLNYYLHVKVKVTLVKMHLISLKLVVES